MLTIHCSRCGAEMHFGEGACGRRAKCLKCDYVFRLPSKEALMEETVSEWIAEDVDEVLTKRDEMFEERNRPELRDLHYEKAKRVSRSFDSTIGPAISTREAAKDKKSSGKQSSPVTPECRARLETWTSWQPGERLRKYYPDADYAEDDEGKAGVLITNQRLLYRKGHNQGSVGLDVEDAVILARVRGHTASLNLMVGSTRTRMARVTLHHLQRLTREVHNMDRGIKLLIGEAQANETA
ncbi:hypothetical protein [Mucisphaera calidilacus]|uniref:Uncharacterized protein n=1 Tax=Mucisphaera calidilacus TaxID=2527982 RepID=A0A518C1B4_9BACT|nr:hypothetical protein [Mucisphaera calidilacus]QDU73013.1 hypothetical protein Pan265_28910 [Mucisphaera calidilacus]